MYALIRHNQRFLEFTNPVAVLSTDSPGDIRSHLAYIENQVQRRSLYAVGFLSYEASLAFDPAFVVHPRPSDAPLLLFGLFHAPVKKSALPPQSLDQPHWDPLITHEEYCRAVAAIQDDITAGRTYQVNYTYRLESRFQGNPLGLFSRWYAAQPAAYASFIDCDQYAVCSVSPELFFSLNGERLTTRPMKGTARRGLLLEDDRANADWLRHSAKNRAENCMIVDMIRNDMGRISRTGTVQVQRLFTIEKYPTLWQMTSTISSRTRADIAAIFGALFPCGSITGAPKIETMKIIADRETSPRGIYTGAIGCIFPGRRARFAVAIRTAWINKSHNRMRYGAGGGIVSDSECSREYEESRLKTRVLFTPAAQFDLLETMRWERKSGWSLLAEHCSRLARSASYFDYPCDTDSLIELLEDKTRSFSAPSMRVRITLDSKGSFSIDATPLGVRPPEPIRMGIAKERVHSSDPMLYHKTTRRSRYDAARQSLPGCDEAALVNEHGELTETSIGNLVLRFGDTLVTPHWRCGLLPGVFRQVLLQSGVIVEQRIPANRLREANAIFRINSVRQWQECACVDYSYD